MPTRADESDTQAIVDCQNAALGIAENLEACEAALESEKRLCAAREQLLVRTAREAGDLKLQGAEARINVLASALEEAEERADREVWEHPAWWVVGGFIGGVVVASVLVYSSIWAVGQLRPVIPPAELTE